MGLKEVWEKVRDDRSQRRESQTKGLKRMEGQRNPFEKDDSESRFALSFSGICSVWYYSV